MNLAKQYWVVLGAVILTGCNSIQRTTPVQVWPDMKHQARFRAQLSTEFYPEIVQAGLFPDGRQTRGLPQGVVARGHMIEDTPFTTGMDGKNYVGRIPVPVTEEMIADGQVRFNIYCSPCHDRTGMGNGMVPQRALNFHPANLMSDRIVDFADGEIFNIVTYGRRTMPPYEFQTSIEERWHIISYLRVLQRSAHGKVGDVPDDLRSSLTYKGAANQ